MTAMIERIPARDFDGAMMEDVEHAGLWLRVAAFDNLGQTADRYTVLVEQDVPWADPEHGDYDPETWSFYASAHPSSPQGVGMTDELHRIDESDGNYVIPWGELPDAVRSAVWRIAATGWLLGTPAGSAMLAYDFDAQRWYVERFLHSR